MNESLYFFGDSLLEMGAVLVTTMRGEAMDAVKANVCKDASTVKFTLEN